MNQKDYDIIVACIQHGVPALATSLINSLNTIVEKANQLTELQRQQAETAHKAEVAKTEALAKELPPK